MDGPDTHPSARSSSIMHRLEERIPGQEQHGHGHPHHPHEDPYHQHQHQGYYDRNMGYGYDYEPYGDPYAAERHREYRDRSERYKRHRSRSRDRDRRDRDRHRSSRRSRSRSRSRRERKRSSSRDRHRSHQEKRSSRHGSPVPENVTPVHLRPRKLKNWDMPPPDYEVTQVQEAKASGKFPLPCHLLTGNGHAVQTHYGIYRAEIVKPTQGALGAIAVAATVTRQARRLYVAGITPEMNEQNLVAFLNEEYDRRNLPKPEPGNAVISAYINYEKAYSFVEFRSEEEAAHALSFDNVRFMEQNLRVRRPNNYVGDKENDKTDKKGGVSGSSDSPNKIYIGGLPNNLTSDQVMELLQSFGPLKMFNLIIDHATGLSKGYAFCEYEDPDVTSIACQGLNGMELGPKRLIVQLASVGSAAKNQDRSSMIPNVMGANVDPTAILAESETTGPTSVLLLLNIVLPDDLLDDSLYQDMLAEMKEECSLYGTVEDVMIPRPEGDNEGLGQGRVFVRFASSEDASKAHEALAGREFNERIVITSYYDEEKFASGVFF